MVSRISLAADIRRLPFAASVILFAVIANLLVFRSALAARPGQEDLDKATDLKITAATAKDLDEVVVLTERALKKGLDRANEDFARRLLAATLINRAQETTKHIFTDVVDARDFRRRRELAISDLNRAAKLDPKQPQAYLLIAQLNMLPGGNGVKDVREALDKAIALGIDDPSVRAKALVLRAGLQDDKEKKLADFTAAIQLTPNDAGTIRARGFALSEMGRLGPALADFSRAIELEPDDAATLEAKAMLLARLQRFDEALSTLDRSRQLNPDSAGPLLERAKIHCLQRNLAAALDDLNQACAADPGNVQALLMRGNIHAGRNEKNQAIADINQALKLKPDLPVALRARAWYLLQSGRTDEAVADLEKLLVSEPRDLPALFQLATAHLGQRKTERAIRDFSAMLAIDPRLWQAWRGRADCYLALGKHAEAAADYDKTLQCGPHDEVVLNNLAWILAASPDKKVRNGRRALRLATEACQMTGYKQPSPLAALAAACAEVGDFEAAVKWSEKAIDLGGKAPAIDVAPQLESYKAKKPWRATILVSKM
jgi:tetratricopeptide (TPR) repeat protein